MPGFIKIAIAEDHSGYRDLVAGIFLEYRFAVVACSTAEPGFVDLLDENNLPDVIVVGCSTLYPKGVALVKGLRKKYPFVKILVTALFQHYLPEKELEQVKVEGWLMKSTCDPKLLIKAVAELYKGRLFFHKAEDYCLDELYPIHQ